MPTDHSPDSSARQNLVRGTTVLPSRRHPLTLHTADGLELVGELAVPLSGSPRATLVWFHPLPIHGGMMDSHLLRKAANRLPEMADLAVLRFNTRGTGSSHGTSDGAFDEARSERHDVAAAIEYAEYHDLPEIWLVGWSYGTDLVLKYGCDPVVTGAVLVSPPLRYTTDAELDVWAAAGKPLTALIPEYDDFLQPAEARRRFARVPQAEVVTIHNAYHLLVGHTEEVLDEIVLRVVPEKHPLPEHWPPSASHDRQTHHDLGFSP